MNVHDKIYGKHDYKGEFNLLAAERELMVKALTRSQTKIGACHLVGISIRTFDRKMDAHRIKMEEWKKQKINPSIENPLKKEKLQKA